MLDHMYTVVSLPVTDDFLPEKRAIQDRGELALVCDGPVMRHIGYFSLRPGPQHFRGGHYHQRKAETYYVIRGSASVVLCDVDSGERQNVTVSAGDKLTVSARCAHRFAAHEFCEVIEYCSEPHDSRDDYPYAEF